MIRNLAAIMLVSVVSGLFWLYLRQSEQRPASADEDESGTNISLASIAFYVMASSAAAGALLYGTYSLGLLD